MHTHHSDQTVTCQSCGTAFVFSAGEQELLRLRGVCHTPANCPRCRRRYASK
jgi:hypothetical protein